MDLIHSLCFADNSAPDAVVIRTLIGYVIGERKEGKDGGAEKKKGMKWTAAMTPVPESVDRTPIFRSFLLQLLLRAKSVAISIIFSNAIILKIILYYNLL